MATPTALHIEGPSAARPPERRVSAAHRVYEQVRKMAITFRFRPGQRINEVELARRLQVSRTPVREALNRLVTEGFLHAEKSRGFLCRELDAKDVFSLYEFRCYLEAASVRLACKRGRPEEFARLHAFLEACAHEIEDAEVARLVALDEAFHERVAELGRNGELLDVVRRVNARIHFVRLIETRTGLQPDAHAEHVRIVRAMKAGEADAAADMMSRHITRRRDQIVDVIRAGFAEIYMQADATERFLGEET